MFIRLFLLIGLSLVLSSSRAGFLEDWAKMKAMAPKEYLCYRAASPIVIDGRLDDPAWDKIPWTTDFRDIEGEGKPKPRFRTRAKMCWDDTYFYVGAELEEPDVWATLTEHDSVIFRDNDFEVFIDPNGDSHEYYEFEINALNTGWDLLLKKPYKDGGPALNSWEIPGLKTAVHVNGTLNDFRDKDAGWTVEIAFPWKALGEYAHRPSPPHETDQWRVNFSRVEWQVETSGNQRRKVPGTKEDNWVWSPQGIVDMHRPEKWAFVEFTQRAPGTATFHSDQAAAAAREVLHEVYYAEKDHWEKTKSWTGDMRELGIPKSGTFGTVKPVLRLTRDGFEVTAAVQRKNGQMEKWHIRQDARVWKE